MTFALALAVPAAALAVPASATLRDFRLPADRPQPPSDVQGPVAPDVPASRRLTPTPTPTPSPNREESPAPPPTEQAPRVEVPAGLQPAPRAEPTRRAAATAPRSAEPTPAAGAAPAPEPSTPALPSAAPSPLPSAAAPADLAATVEDSWPLSWVAGGIALLVSALAVAGGLLRRRVRASARPGAVPQIERPHPATGEQNPDSHPAAEPLQISLEPLRLSLTLMNATLAWRLELANRGTAPLTGLTIGADMISAHASLSRDEQLSGPRADGAQVQRIERLEPGESRVIAGEFRLPFPQIVPIRQGNTALLLPLARFRVEGDGARSVVRTFVVGLPGEGNGLQPFRLDQGPRIYPRLAQHAFA